jgi:hypothetical protein
MIDALRQGNPLRDLPTEKPPRELKDPILSRGSRTQSNSVHSSTSKGRQRSEGPAHSSAHEMRRRGCDESSTNARRALSDEAHSRTQGGGSSSILYTRPSRVHTNRRRKSSCMSEHLAHLRREERRAKRGAAACIAHPSSLPSSSAARALRTCAAPSDSYRIGAPHIQRRIPPGPGIDERHYDSSESSSLPGRLWVRTLSYLEKVLMVVMYCVLR